MIYFNKTVAQKLNKIKNSNYYVVADFSKTITSCDGKSTWSLIADTNLMPSDYKQDRQTLYDKYHPYEVDGSLSKQEKDIFLTEWWTKHLALFVKFAAGIEVFEKIATSGMLKLREGADDFFAALNKNNIPMLIVTSGLGEVVNQLLIKHRLNTPNVHLLGNTLCFENNTAVGYAEDIIHPYNKKSVVLSEQIADKLKKRPNIFLFGDIIEDIEAIPPTMQSGAIKIGFLNNEIPDQLVRFKEVFDIVCTKNTTFNELSAQIKEKYGFCF